MNEAQIREAFHRKYLLRQHMNASTIVVDELGLHHGKFRADIAVVNCKLVGYEIKSDNDTLRRLKDQIQGYTSIFNKVFLISTERHIDASYAVIPQWWGMILAYCGTRGGIHFRQLRSARDNPLTDNQALAKLLWRNEAVELLEDFGVQGKALRKRREVLYSDIAEKVSSTRLRLAVRDFLMKRQNWRDRSQSVQYDG